MSCQAKGLGRGEGGRDWKGGSGPEREGKGAWRCSEMTGGGEEVGEERRTRREAGVGKGKKKTKYSWVERKRKEGKGGGKVGVRGIRKVKEGDWKKGQKSKE